MPTNNTAEQPIAEPFPGDSGVGDEPLSYMAAALRALAVPLDDLIPDPRNANTHPRENLDAIKESVRRFGVRKPAVVNEVDGVCHIEAGEGLWMALRELREETGGILFTHIPVVRVADGEVDAMAFGLVDNHAGKLSVWDDAQRTESLAYLDGIGFDITSLGFSPDDLMARTIDVNDLLAPEPHENAILKEQKDREAVDEWNEDVQPRVQTGQRWRLGAHGLVCGDAYDPAVLRQLLYGVKPTLVCADPPYGIALDTRKRRTLSPGAINKHAVTRTYPLVTGDDRAFNPAPLIEYFDEMGVADQFWWGAQYYWKDLPAGGSLIVWDKRAGLEEVDWSAGEFELCWSKVAHRQRIIRVRWMGVCGMETQDTNRRCHPNQKPLQLYEDFYNEYTKPGALVCDPFLGSGTAIMAGHRTGRTVYGIEIEPRYCDIILARYQALTGEAPVLEDV